MSVDSPSGWRPEVTAIVAAWNSENTIERCVQSILTQRGVSVELILVDDCSTDATSALATELSAGCQQMRVLRTRSNCGPSAARNVGIEAARGDWIAVVDADDDILPDRFATMRAFVLQRDADIVFDNLIVVTELRGRELSRDLFIDQAMAEELFGPWLVGDYLNNNLPYESHRLLGFLKPMFRRRFLLQNGIHYNLSLRVNEDFFIILSCLLCGAKIAFINQPGYNYRRRAGSLSRTSSIDSSRLLVEEERLLMARFSTSLEKEGRVALLRHMRAVEKAAHTDRLFQMIRNRDVLSLIRLLLARPDELPVHLRRIGVSAMRTLLKRERRMS